jgi:hypothetical protein
VVESIDGLVELMELLKGNAQVVPGVVIFRIELESPLEPIGRLGELASLTVGQRQEVPSLGIVLANSDPVAAQSQQLHRLALFLEFLRVG